MALQQNTSCADCGSGRVVQKLGGCKECVFFNIFGAAFCWLISCLLFFLYPMTNAVYASLGFGCFFTALLLAHGIAFIVRAAKA